MSRSRLCSPRRLVLERLEDRCLLSAGSLDATFGTGGLVTTDVLGSDPDTAHAVSVTQPNGKIIVAGQSGVARVAQLEFALARYNANGTLDASFGTGGHVFTLFPTFDANITGIVVQPDGKIVAAGYTASAGGGAVDVALARYNPDGSLDVNFGSGGTLTTSFSQPGLVVTSQANAVALQPDGDIVVAGTANFNPGSGFKNSIIIARYTPGGDLDPNFGSGGKVRTDLTAGSQDFGFALVRQSDGKLVVGGRASDNMAVLRYTTTGALDAGFGTGGVVTTAFAAGQSTAYGVTLQSGGQIVAAGAAGAVGSRQFALARYMTGGALDGTFGTGGTVTTAIGSDAAAAGVVLTGNKILAGGTTGVSPDGDFAAAHYNGNGSLDNSFGSGGTVVTDFNGGDEQGAAIALRSGGNFVIVGTTSTNHGDFALAGYKANGSLDTGFGSHGRVVTDLRSSADDFAGALATGADGKYIVAGSSFVDTGLDLSVTRYNANGTPDTTFGINGQATVALPPLFFGGVTGAAVQLNGKILVSGDLFGSELFVVRLNANGSLDTTFGSGGMATFELAGFTSSAGLVLQPDGKIVIAGTTQDQDTFLNDVVLVRFNSDGSPDASFGSGGAVIQTFGADESAAAVVRLAGGKLLVAGTVQGPNDHDFLLVRFNADGSVDTSFGTGGEATADLGGDDTAAGVAVTLGGKIIVAGTTVNFNDFTGDFGVARFNADGTADPTFGGSGFVVTDLGGDDHGTGVAIQSGGHIVVAGYTSDTGSIDLARYNVDGSLDTTFGSGGTVTTLFPGGPVFPFNSSFLPVTPRVVITPGDKILTATSVLNPDPTGLDFALARYVGTETASATDSVLDTPALDPVVLGAFLGDVLVNDAVILARALLNGSPTLVAQSQALVNGLYDLDLYFAQ
jgi:uncharacterized delta-60 repeat protein